MSIRTIRTLAVAAAGLAAISSGAAIAATRQSASVGTGVVVINTNLRLEDTWAAGTGMVLTSSGRILTNNHVIAGATTIRVAVPNTTRRYAARVVGYDMADDIAVLQLRRASNLSSVALGSSTSLSVGSSVTAVGNSGGFGRLISARGRVLRLGRSVLVESEAGIARLNGLIETNAAVRPGDSGGPLLDGTDRVVGMTTAASPYGGHSYAIPIAGASRVIDQIVRGRASKRVHIGPTALLGVQVQGTTIAEIVPGSPAQAAGLKPGDIIVSIGGKRVTGEAGITSAVLAYRPGQVVKVVYIDETGAHRTARVKLVTGPPQ